MPETLRYLVDRMLTRLITLWVKPDVLPEDPSKLINPQLPVVYVLEVGGVADRAALAIAVRRFNLPNPTKQLAFGAQTERSSVIVLQQRRGLFLRRHRQVLSQRLARLVAAGQDPAAGELQIVPVSVYWGRAPDKESSIFRLWFSENWQIAGRFRKLLTTLLYDGIEVKGVERLKAVADGREIVYVPCHRSHIDYLLLSYVLYIQGFSLPHIAAGINLNLPIIGGLLRRGGAFFLRRSFAGLPLYSAVFNSYLKELLQRGHALEYFVEGGRSRTGRLLPPKGGMLAMTVHAYLTQPQTPVVFVPVYFGYERLLEGGAFTSELAGGKKQRESVFALIKSLRTLREDYGRVYVSFGEPIELEPLLELHQPAWRNTAVDWERPKWVKPLIDDLGITIMQRINEAACVTPISLLATTLLATPQGCISIEELEQQLSIYVRLLKGAYANTLVTVPDIDAQHLVNHGARLGFIKTITDEIGPMVELQAGQHSRHLYQSSQSQ